MIKYCTSLKITSMLGGLTVKDVRTEQMLQLLQTASNRQRDISDETVAFNLLSALHIERYETKTHSHMCEVYVLPTSLSAGICV